MASATVSTVPTAISVTHEPGSGASPTGVPSGGRMNSGAVTTLAARTPSPVPATPSAVCSASSMRTTCPGVNPSAFSIAMSCRCISTRPAVTFAMAQGAATSAMIPNSASSSPSNRSSLAIELSTCCEVENRCTTELSLGPPYVL